MGPIVRNFWYFDSEYTVSGLLILVLLLQLLVLSFDISCVILQLSTA